LLTFTQFVDTPNAGTVLEDLMVWTQKLIEKKVTGIIHVANDGWSSPYKIALLLKKYVLPELEVNLISKEELDQKTPVKRVDTVLNIDKLKSLIGENYVSNYEDRVEDIVIQLGKNLANEDKEKVKEVFEKTLEHTKLRATPNEVWKKLIV